MKNTQGNLIRLAGTNGCPSILVRPGPRLVTVHASATFPGGAVGSRSLEIRLFISPERQGLGLGFMPPLL